MTSFSKRIISSLPNIRVLHGARWDYHILDVVVGDGTHTSSVFKGKVVNRLGLLKQPQW